MKQTLLPLLFCTLVGFNANASIEAAQTAIDNQQYQQATKLLKKQLKDKSTANQAYMMLSEVALAQGELDDAEDYIDKLVKRTPKDAEAHFLYAQVMAAQAQNSNIFSAAGYAKDSLRGFEKAAELQPDEVIYRKGLMRFYLGAPSIVGGDNDKALAQAKAIEKLDKKQGLGALFSVYQALENKSQVSKLVKTIEQDYPQDPQLNYHRARYLQKSESWALAVDAYDAVSKMPEVEEDDKWIKLSALYRLGQVCVQGELKQDQGMAALKTFIDTAPVSDQIPPKEWAKFRYALLLEQTGKRDEAKSLYRKIKANSKDKQLIKEIKRQL